MSRRNNKPQSTRSERRQSRNPDRFADYQPVEMIAIPERRAVEPLYFMTTAQHQYATSIEDNTITFGIGPAGTGKSYVALSMAADKLQNKEIDKIIITRPAVEAGESFGFLPGELEEKFAPYLDPFRDILSERLGKSHVEYLIKHKRIEAKPLAFMRGITLKNCWAILDEAQNTTPAQMKLFLTRIGENCKAIVDGDCEQKDIKMLSGLTDAVNRFQNTRRVGIVEFMEKDIVRSGIVRDVIRAYASWDRLHIKNKSRL